MQRQAAAAAGAAACCSMQEVSQRDFDAGTRFHPAVDHLVSSIRGVALRDDAGVLVMKVWFLHPCLSPRSGTPTKLDTCHTPRHASSLVGVSLRGDKQNR